MSVIGAKRLHPLLASGVLIAAFSAALVAVLVYLNALDNPFVYDDFRLIVENSSIQNGSSLESVIVRDITRPGVNLSYAIDTALWGQTPVGYHVTNLLLHVVNVVLVFWVAFLASEDRKRQTAQHIGVGASSTAIGWATATLFAVHPMMTQAVGYISGRSEVAYSAFFLLAFLAGRRWMLGGGKRWWLTCVGLWFAAMLTKESAAMLSVVLFAYDRFVLDADRAVLRRRFLQLELPLLAVTFLAGAGRIAVLQLVEYPDGRGPEGRFALMAVDSFWGYLKLFFLPRGQSIFHPAPLIGSVFSPRALAGLIGLASFLGLAWVLRRVHSLTTFGLLWFAALLVPSSVLFALGRGEPMAEHRAYLSAAGLFLTWGCAFGTVFAKPRWRAVAGVAAVIFLAQLSARTVVRNVIWDDPVGLAREAQRLAPEQWLPRILLADALRLDGRCNDAIPEYRGAIAMLPQNEFPYTKLALCLTAGGRLEEAQAVMHKLRALNPGSMDALKGLGVFALLDGRVAESRVYLREVMAQTPGDGQATLMLALIEGSLPADKVQEVCADLQTLAGKPVLIDGCRTDTRQIDSDSTISPRN